MSKMGSSIPGEISFASLIEQFAENDAEKPAIIMDRTLPGQKKSFKSMSFQELSKKAEKIASGLRSLGVGRGHRVLMFLMPDQDFAVFNLALNRLLAVPVLVDLGMGVRNMLRCIEQCEPTAMVGIPKSYLLRWLNPRAFRSIKISIISKKSWLWRSAYTIEQLLHLSDIKLVIEKPNASETATIVFTSGSTGVSKGVVLTHEQIAARRRVRDKSYGLDEDGIELSTFPAFLLMSIASGRTCVLPHIDLTRPAKANPEYVVGAIQSHDVSSFFASPALLDRLTRYCLVNRVQLPTVNRIVTGGAPIACKVISRFNEIAPQADVIVAYGATEALPISQIELKEIVEQTEPLSQLGRGTCVGRPVEETKVAVIENTTDPIGEWDDELCLPPNQVGEIVVKGECVTNRYFGKNAATTNASIPSDINGDPLHWHRTGDLGYVDDEGRIWICGRQAHSFRSGDRAFYPVQVEGILNSLAGIQRTALVRIQLAGETQPAIVYEQDRDQKISSAKLEHAIRAELSRFEIDIPRIYQYPRAFPVDKRHNSKIERLELARWAQKRC